MPGFVYTRPRDLRVGECIKGRIWRDGEVVLSRDLYIFCNISMRPLHNKTRA